MKKILCVLIACSMMYAGTSRSGDIVTDNDTGLMWQDDTDTDTLTKTWTAAITYCEALSLGGYTDWRLPNINELSSIVDYTTYNPGIKSGFINIVNNNYYWSSTTNVNSTSKAWYVNFFIGDRFYLTNTNTAYVRCVRSAE